MNPISKIIIIIAVVIILLAGVLPSIAYSNWEWFGRSGALLTAYGVALAFLDVVGFMNNIAGDVVRRMDEAIEKIDLSKVPEEKVENIEQEKKSIASNDDKRFYVNNIDSFALGHYRTL